MIAGALAARPCFDSLNGLDEGNTSVDNCMYTVKLHCFRLEKVLF